MSSGEHDTQFDDDGDIPKYDSVPLIIQDILKELLGADFSLSAKNLHVNLINMWHSNSKKKKVERQKKYSFEEDLIPSVEKVTFN